MSKWVELTWELVKPISKLPVADLNSPSLFVGYPTFYIVDGENTANAPVKKWLNIINLLQTNGNGNQIAIEFSQTGAIYCRNFVGFSSGSWKIFSYT